MQPRALWIVAIVSLALNLFLVGAVVGALVIGAHKPPMRRGEPRPGPALFAAAQALTPEQQQAYRMALRDQSRAMAPKLREAREARRSAWRRLGEDPVDQAAVARDLDRARALEGEARGAIERRLLAFAAALPADERAQLAERLSRAAPGPRGEGGRRPPPP